MDDLSIWELLEIRGIWLFLSSQNRNMVYSYAVRRLHSSNTNMHSYVGVVARHFVEQEERTEKLEYIQIFTTSPCFLLPDDEACFLEKPTCSYPFLSVVVVR